MATKKGLGRGLNTLIPTDNSEEKKVPTKEIIKEVIIKEGIQTLNISEIEPNKDQPRKQFNEDALQELADSIKQYGIIQPLIVTKRDNYYELIAGERRWRAARLAGLKQVPVIIKDYTNKEIVEIALIENIQREDLNPIEEALAYKRLIEEFSLKQDEVAERVSKSRTAVTNSMRLLKLSDKVQQMLIEDMLSTGHARALLPLEDSTLQHETACKIFDENLSVRETERLIKKILSAPIEKDVVETIDHQFLYTEVENKLKTILGSKINVKAKTNNKGKIEIEYFSKDELERITEMLYSIEK
mgnify:CR=1 FL=1